MSGADDDSAGRGGTGSEQPPAVQRPRRRRVPPPPPGHGPPPPPGHGLAPAADRADAAGPTRAPPPHAPELPGRPAAPPTTPPPPVPSGRVGAAPTDGGPAAASPFARPEGGPRPAVGSGERSSRAALPGLEPEADPVARLTARQTRAMPRLDGQPGAAAGSGTGGLGGADRAPGGGFDPLDWRALFDIYGPTARQMPMAVLAVPLLTLAVKLQASVRQDDIAGLQQHMADTLKGFEEQALGRGVSGEDVMAGRYVLCSTLDELILSTPWGSQSQWGQQSLLSQFHNETWGGEKVFTILDRTIGDPERHGDLLMLIDLCLAVGFEGRYRVLENGRFELQELRRHLFRVLRRRAPAPPDGLSPNWEPVRGGRPLRPLVPLWVVAAVVGVALVGLYTGFAVSLSNEAAPVTERLEALGRDGAP